MIRSASCSKFRRTTRLPGGGSLADGAEGTRTQTNQDTKKRYGLGGVTVQLFSLKKPVVISREVSTAGCFTSEVGGALDRLVDGRLAPGVVDLTPGQAQLPTQLVDLLDQRHVLLHRGDITADEAQLR